MDSQKKAETVKLEFFEVMNMKKIITLVLCLVIALSMVGCGAKDTGNGTPVAGGADMTMVNDGVNTEKTQEATIEDEAFNPDTPDYGLTLTAKDITNSGLTLVFTQSGGNPTGELQTGSDFSIEVNENGYWKPVETIIPLEELAWTAEAYEIAKGGMLEMDISWIYFYGELQAGSYRIRKPIMDFRGTGDYDIDSVYVEFEIK